MSMCMCGCAYVAVLAYWTLATLCVGLLLVAGCLLDHGYGCGVALLVVATCQYDDWLCLILLMHICNYFLELHV